jgi:hypothetical protein
MRRVASIDTPVFIRETPDRHIIGTSSVRRGAPYADEGGDPALPDARLHNARCTASPNSAV